MVVDRLCDGILSTRKWSIKKRVVEDTTSHSSAENMRLIHTNQCSPVRTNTRGCPDVAYYTCRPPIIPMYVIPISSYYREQKAGDIRQQKLKVKNYEAKKIVHNVLVSIINRAVRVVTGSHSRKNLHTINCNVAIQTKTDKQDMTMEEDAISSSSASGVVRSGWVEDVRALRDSHVRLVLRQLRQLRDIERLDRTLRRTSTTQLKYHT